MSRVVPGSTRLATGTVARISETIEVTCGRGIEGNPAVTLSLEGMLRLPIDNEGSRVVRLSTAGTVGTVTGRDIVPSPEVKLPTNEVGTDMEVTVGRVIGGCGTVALGDSKALVPPPRMDIKLPTGFKDWVSVYVCCCEPCRGG